MDVAFYTDGADAVRLGEELHHNGLTLRSAQIGRTPRGTSGHWDRARLSAEMIRCSTPRGDAICSHPRHRRAAARGGATADARRRCPAQVGGLGGVHRLTWTQWLSLLLVLMVSSEGAAGVTGSGFVALAATLSAVAHVPVAALALTFGVERFMSEGRAR